MLDPQILKQDGRYEVAIEMDSDVDQANLEFGGVKLYEFCDQPVKTLLKS